VVNRRYRTGLRRALLRLAALILLISTSTAYADCCFVESDAQTPSMEMPCHQSNDTVAEAGDDCCSMCLPLMNGTVLVKTTAPAPLSVSVLGNETPLSNGLDPPFRPPI